MKNIIGKSETMEEELLLFCQCIDKNGNKCSQRVRKKEHRFVHGHNASLGMSGQFKKGKPHQWDNTVETKRRENISVASIKKYKSGWKYQITNEARKKLSVALRKVKHTWNTKKGYVCSEESRERYRVARLRKVFPFKDSQIEKLLEGALLARGLLFEKHYPIKGQPDFAWPDRHVAVFADGRFFHGDPREFKASDKQLNGVTMEDIRKKDSRITTDLESQGWTVLRFWEKEIRANPSRCVDDIERCLSEYELSSKGQ